MDTSILEDLGLTNAEIKVYLSLLELGSSTAGPILEKSGLQNSVVHRTLHRLLEKGLITYVLEGKRKYYQAINPERLIDFIEAKKERFENILPELKAKQELSKKKPEAIIYRGIRGCRELIRQMADTDTKEYIAYGGPKKSNDMLGEYFWISFHRTKLKKGIKSKLIFHESLKEWGKGLNKKGLATVRYTKKEFEDLTETIICGDKVAIVIYTDQPYGFLIHEETAARSYRKFFDMLWDESIK